jgi:hypothetical protein
MLNEIVNRRRRAQARPDSAERTLPPSKKISIVANVVLRLLDHQLPNCRAPFELSTWKRIQDTLLESTSKGQTKLTTHPGTENKYRIVAKHQSAPRELALTREVSG